MRMVTIITTAMIMAMTNSIRSTQAVDPRAAASRYGYR
jgi:hypothetical protein